MEQEFAAEVSVPLPPPSPQHTRQLRAEIRDGIEDWEDFQSGTAKRKQVLPLRKLVDPNCLFWGQPTAAVIHQATTARLLALRKRTHKQDAQVDWDAQWEAWQEQAAEAFSVPAATEMLAWAQGLPHLLPRLDKGTWIGVLATLLGHADQSLPGSPRTLLRLLLRCELPLTLAYQLPELSACTELRDSARREFEHLMDAACDGEGMPHARDIGDSALLLASCTRILAYDAALPKKRIRKAARLQFDWLSRQCLRFTRADGSAIFSPPADTPSLDDLFRYLAEHHEDAGDQLAFNLLRGKRQAAKRLAPACDAPPPAEHSQWSELGVLRTDWKPQATRLAVDYSQPDLRLELGRGRHLLWNGAYPVQLRIGNEAVHPATSWTEVCWESDEDMDYLELECTLTNEWRLQRQFLLSRADHVVFFGDAVLGTDEASIVYQQPFPLADDVTLEHRSEANEATILNGQRRGTIIPLSLPEWQAESRDDRLCVDPARWEMRRTGRALYAAFVVDLHPDRFRKALTWRHLTVAENLQRLPPDAAAAYRLQIGKQQWVFYRSLDRPANRTFLGLNYTSEFFAGRFLKNGEVETLVDIAGETAS